MTLIGFYDQEDDDDDEVGKNCIYRSDGSWMVTDGLGDKDPGLSQHSVLIGKRTAGWWKFEYSVIFN